MYPELQINDMKKEDIDQAVELWIKQYQLYCNREEFPKYWITNTGEIKGLLEKQVQNHTAVIAKQGNQIVGFMGYFIFDFHNEKSALCNTTSHAAAEMYKEQIYLALYKHVSKQWVENNLFNHLWMFFRPGYKIKVIFILYSIVRIKYVLLHWKIYRKCNHLLTNLFCITIWNLCS